MTGKVNHAGSDQGKEQGAVLAPAGWTLWHWDDHGWCERGSAIQRDIENADPYSGRGSDTTEWLTITMTINDKRKNKVNYIYMNQLPISYFPGVVRTIGLSYKALSGLGTISCSTSSQMQILIVPCDMTVSCLQLPWQDGQDRSLIIHNK